MTETEILFDLLEKGISPAHAVSACEKRLTDAGFEVVDTTENGYELLALSFDGTTPGFAQYAKKQEIESEELTIYYDMQCPYIYQNIEMIKQYCETNDIPVSLIQVDTLQKAKEFRTSGCGIFCLCGWIII